MPLIIIKFQVISLNDNAKHKKLNMDLQNFLT